MEGISATGPYPPDTIFNKAYKGEVDIVVCMYHDQGLIPLKMIAFDKGVNVTIGLPIIRTSPDHGTAYDIAWSGQADPSSMIEALKLALQMKLCMTKKHLGQNFLYDSSILKRIIDSAGLSEEDTVVEIGPGPGRLTRMLS